MSPEVVGQLFDAVKFAVPFVAVIITALSPLILERRRAETALLQKKFEITYEHKVGVLQRFLDAYLAYADSLSSEDARRFQEASAFAKVEFGGVCRKAIDNIIRSIWKHGRPTDISDTLFEETLALIGEYLDDLGRLHAKEHGRHRHRKRNKQ